MTLNPFLEPLLQQVTLRLNQPLNLLNENNDRCCFQFRGAGVLGLLSPGQAPEPPAAKRPQPAISSKKRAKAQLQLQQPVEVGSLGSTILGAPQASKPLDVDAERQTQVQAGNFPHSLGSKAFCVTVGGDDISCCDVTSLAAASIASKISPPNDIPCTGLGLLSATEAELGGVAYVFQSTQLGVRLKNQLAAISFDGAGKLKVQSKLKLGAEFSSDSTFQPLVVETDQEPLCLQATNETVAPFSLANPDHPQLLVPAPCAIQPRTFTSVDKRTCFASGVNGIQSFSIRDHGTLIPGIPVNTEGIVKDVVCCSIPVVRKGLTRQLLITAGTTPQDLCRFDCFSFTTDANKLAHEDTLEIADFTPAAAIASVLAATQTDDAGGVVCSDNTNQLLQFLGVVVH